MILRLALCAALVSSNVASASDISSPKIIKNVIPRLRFEFGTVRLGLVPKITKNTSSSASAEINLSAEHDLTNTETQKTVSSYDVINKTVTTLASNVGFQGTKPTFSMTAGGNRTTTLDDTFSSQDTRVREDVVKYIQSARRTAKFDVSHRTELEDPSGYISVALNISNFETRAVTVKALSIVFEVLAPSSGDRVQPPIGPATFGSDSIVNGTLLGNTKITVAESNEFVVEPVSVLGHPYTRNILIEKRPNSEIIQLLKSGYILRPKIQHFTVALEKGSDVDSFSAEADLLSRSSEIDVVRPSGIEEVAFFEADGHSTLLDALNSLGYKPHIGTDEVISLFGVDSANTATPKPPELYSADMNAGRWVIDVNGQISQLTHLITNGDVVSIAYVTNLDLVRAFPPRFKGKREETLYCNATDPTRGFGFANVMPGTSFKFVIAVSRYGSIVKTATASDLVSPPLTLPGNERTWWRDALIMQAIQAESRYIDPIQRDDVLLEDTLDNADLSLIDGTSRRIPLSKLVEDGEVTSGANSNGSAEVTLVATDNLLQNAESGFGTLYLQASLPTNLTATLGRTSVDPPLPSGHMARVPGGPPTIWDYAAMWRLGVPSKVVPLKPSQVWSVDWEAIMPIRVLPSGKLQYAKDFASEVDYGPKGEIIPVLGSGTITMVPPSCTVSAP